MSIEKIFKGYNKFIFLAVFLFILARLYLILKLPDVIDESMYLYKLYLMTKGWQIYVNFGDNRMPGFFYMAYPFMYIYSLVARPPYDNIVFIGRISTIITSLVTIFFIYKIGKYLKSERAGFIAILLFMINPFALGLYSDIFLENFMVVFSLAGFYYFIKGIEEGSDKNLFIASIFFGISVSIKQTAVLLFPIAIFVTLLKFYKLNLGFLKKILIIISGGLLPVSIIMGYFIHIGILGNFLYAMTTSVQQSYAWANPSQDTIINNYVVPSLEANELLTLIIGTCGLIFSLLLIFIKRDKYFGIKTLSLWVIGYIAVMSTSNNYGYYYIPVIPSLVLLSAYLIDNYIIDSFLMTSGNYRKAFVIILIGLLLAIDFYHTTEQYQNFTLNPAKQMTILTPPIDQQIFIGDYIYNHTNETDKVFSIASIYPLIAGREVVNHYTVSGNRLPTIEELKNALSDKRVKYAIIDDRTYFHFRREWAGENITNLRLSMDLNLEEMPLTRNQGISIELRNRNNSANWWLLSKGNPYYPYNDTNSVHYSLPVQKGWQTLNINLTSGFEQYFGYGADDYTLALWSHGSDGNHVKFQINKVKLWDDHKTFIDQNFDNNLSLKNFNVSVIDGKNTNIGGWNNIYFDNGSLGIDIFNKNLGLLTLISTGVDGYIYTNFDKEIDFIITARETEESTSVVSLFKKKF